MERPFIRLYSYTSIDGKIDGFFKEETGSISSRFFYDDEIKRLNSSIISGRITSLMRYSNNNVSLDDFKADKLLKVNSIFYQPDLKYYFCFDRKGKVFFNENKVTFGSEKYKVVEILTSRVDPRFVEYLKSKDIDYFFVDYKNDILEALDIIKKEYHVSDLLLISGATLNTSFLSLNVLDSLSLVVAPYIDGNNMSKGIFNTDKEMNKSKFILKESHQLNDGGVYLNFIKERNDGEVY